ncbi:MAG: hypothetical protein KJ734_14550, partial [Chloroflexi bacterium]|nr:hypothetical protein [Chloroflexota bacterium]
LVLCCLGTAALALFWPDSPVSLMNLLGGPASPTPITEPTQTPTFITPTFTVGAPQPTTVAPTAAQPSGPTLTPTEPPPTRVRTPAAPTPPPLPTVTLGPTRTSVPPTAAGPRYRLKETRLIEEKVGLGYIHVFVLDQNGQGIQGIVVRIDGGDPNSWKLDVTTDVRGLAEFNALSANIYTITLVDYGVAASGIDRTNKNWEVVFEAY